MHLPQRSVLSVNAFLPLMQAGRELSENHGDSHSYNVIVDNKRRKLLPSMWQCSHQIVESHFVPQAEELHISSFSLGNL